MYISRLPEPCHDIPNNDNLQKNTLKWISEWSWLIVTKFAHKIIFRIFSSYIRKSRWSWQQWCCRLMMFFRNSFQKPTKIFVPTLKLPRILYCNWIVQVNFRLQRLLYILQSIYLFVLKWYLKQLAVNLKKT